MLADTFIVGQWVTWEAWSENMEIFQTESEAREYFEETKAKYADSPITLFQVKETYKP